MTLDKPATLVEMALTVSQVPLELTDVTEQREKQVTPVKTVLEAHPVKREQLVSLDLQENPDDPVWTEQREKEDETESLVDLESPVEKEIQGDLEALENQVVEESLDVMELRENLVEEAWTVVRVLLELRETEVFQAGVEMMELLECQVPKVVMVVLVEEVYLVHLEKMDCLAEVVQKELMVPLATLEEM